MKRWIVGVVIALLSLYVITLEAGTAYRNVRWDQCLETTQETEDFIECIDQIPFTFSGFANLVND